MLSPQSCPTDVLSWICSPPGSLSMGLSRQNTGVDCHALLQDREVQAINSPGGETGCLPPPSSLDPSPDAATLPAMNWEPPPLLRPFPQGRAQRPPPGEGTAPSLKSWPFPWKSVPPQPGGHNLSSHRGLETQMPKVPQAPGKAGQA